MHNAKLSIGGVDVNLSIEGPENIRPHITREMLHAFQDAVQKVVTEHVAAAPVIIAAAGRSVKSPDNIEALREIRMPRAEWPFQIKP